MRIMFFALAATLLIASPASPQQPQPPPQVVAPLQVRPNLQLHLETDSPAAGRHWATQALQLPVAYLGEPWQAAARPGTRVAQAALVKIQAINPNAIAASVTVNCHDTHGAVAFTRAVSIDAMGANVVVLDAGAFRTVGTLWCEVRADHPILVSGAFYMQELASSVPGGAPPIGITEESVAPIHTWLLER